MKVTALGRFLPVTTAVSAMRMEASFATIAIMNLTDAVIALLLASRIHGTDEAIRATAKRCAKLLPREKRELMYKIVDSRSPYTFVVFVAQNLDLPI